MSVPVRTALVVLSSTVLVASCGDGSSSPTAPADPVSIETRSLAEAIEGRSYQQPLTARGGSGGYSWLLAAGSLPAGLTLDPAGALTGTPVAPGTSSFRIRVTDAAGQTATAQLSIAVTQALAVHTSALATGAVGEGYAGQLHAGGGRGAYAWRGTGAATSWLTVATDGRVTGTPPASGSFGLTIAVTDESGQEATRTLSLVVVDALAIATTVLPSSTQGRPYVAQLVATGGDGAYLWTVESGTLPTGIGLASAGALMGTPQSAGTFTFTVRVADARERAATRSLTLTVEPAPTIQTTFLPPGEPGVPYAVQLTVSGGTGPYAWRVSEGALPAGLTLSGSGSITGTPATAGSASFTVEVSDAASRTHTRALSIVVGTVGTLANGVPVTGIADATGSVRYYRIDVPGGAARLTISTSGGTGDVDLYIRHGQLPGEFAYDCRPLRLGNDETCTVTSPASGAWYVMLRGFSAYTGVRLVATYEG